MTDSRVPSITSPGDASPEDRAGFVVPAWVPPGGASAGSVCLAPWRRSAPAVAELLVSVLDLRPSDVFVDLGSGDGSMVRAVAARSGCAAVGVEASADLVIAARRVPPVVGSGPVVFLHELVGRRALSGATAVFRLAPAVGAAADRFDGVGGAAARRAARRRRRGFGWRACGRSVRTARSAACRRRWSPAGTCPPVRRRAVPPASAVPVRSRRPSRCTSRASRRSAPWALEPPRPGAEHSPPPRWFWRRRFFFRGVGPGPRPRPEVLM